MCGGGGGDDRQTNTETESARERRITMFLSINNIALLYANFLRPAYVDDAYFHVPVLKSRRSNSCPPKCSCLHM